MGVTPLRRAVSHHGNDGEQAVTPIRKLTDRTEDARGGNER